MTDTKKKIAEIREALEKATPGPWHMSKLSAGYLVDDRGKDITVFIEYNEDGSLHVEFENWQNNARLIANAPEWLGFLLDELERLERLNEMLQEEIQRQRAALEEVRECLDDFWDHDTPRRLYKEVRRFAGQINIMEKVINQALSTTSEPTRRISYYGGVS